MGDLDTAAGEIEGNAPHAREEMGEAASPAPGMPPTRGPEASPELRDKRGRTFDPGIHQVDANGAPKLTRDGLLAIKGGRLKALQGDGPQGASGGQGTGSKPPPLPGEEARRAADRERYRTTALVTVSTLSAMATMLGGEHWKPGEGEKAAMVDAWAEYYEVRGIADIPPEVTVAFVTCAWAAGTEKRRADLRHAGGVILARVGLRKNRVGKDDAREAAGGDLQPPMYRPRPDA